MGRGRPSCVVLGQNAAGSHIRCTLGHRRDFFCRGPILTPRPVLDFPAQTTTSLNCFVTPQNGLVTLVFEKKGVFRGGEVGDDIGPWSSHRCVSTSEAYHERNSSVWNTLFEEHRARAKVWLVGASAVQSLSSCGSAGLPERTKTSSCQRSQAPRKGPRPRN